MRTAATEFVYLTQPRDKVAIHTLWNSLFHVVAPLSGDRAHLLSKIEEIPEVAGGSPIYDALLLSGLQHPLYRNGEQPAIVVLTDGMDNQFEAPGRGSVIPFEKLRAAVAEWPIPIYTLLLPYESKDLQERGARNMKQISEVTGGRLFEIASMRDLPVVYEQVEEELRSVYTIGYYPKNQSFDGSWRTVRVKVKRPGLTVRTRAGYRAE